MKPPPSSRRQSARRLQHEKDIVVTLSHESSALQSRLEVEQDAIQRMEAVLELVERFQSGESAPGEGPSLQVPPAPMPCSYTLYSYTLY